MGRELTQFKPGNPGGPGRPKGSLSLTGLLKKALKQTQVMDNSLPGERNAAETLVESMIYHAIKGNPALAKQIFDRVDGLQQPEEPAPTVKPGVIDAAREKADARKRTRKPDGPPG